MKILSLSDVQLPFIYSPQVRSRFQGVDLVLGCGDLSYHYLEYVFDALNVPLYFVRGNHDILFEDQNQSGAYAAPLGGIDLHRRARCYEGLLLAGVEGCQRYRIGPFQYSQNQMWLHVFSLVPQLMSNRLHYGRWLDVFVTHAPLAGIHDQNDLPHHGIKAFRWLVNVFQPAYHFHGHVHVLRPDTITNSQFGHTRVINTFGFRETEFTLAS
jgi:uncharacterized protein